MNLEKVLTVSEVAELLNTTRPRIKYAIESGKVPEVRMLGNRRVFSTADILNIKRVLEGENCALV